MLNAISAVVRGAHFAKSDTETRHFPKVSVPSENKAFAFCLDFDNVTGTGSPDDAHLAVDVDVLLSRASSVH
jgi:stress response protein SCP2